MIPRFSELQGSEMDAFKLFGSIWPHLALHRTLHISGYEELDRLFGVLPLAEGTSY